MSKWDDVRSEIIHRVDVLGEYRRWGFKPAADEPNERGWISGFAIGREDSSPSAGVNVGTSGFRGNYRDFGGESYSFFYAAAAFGGFGSPAKAVEHYANVAGVDLPEPKEEALEPTTWEPISPVRFCASNPGVKPESLQRFGAIKAVWKSHKVGGTPQVVFVFPVLGSEGIRGRVVMATTGKHVFVSPGKGKPLQARRKHTLKGGKDGWMNQEAVELLFDPQNKVEVVWKCEGLTDALALYSIIPPELRDRHVVITNAGGATAHPDRDLMSLLKGKLLFIVHDADRPGQLGARKFMEGASVAGVKGFNVELPYEIEEKHGKDLRDFILEGSNYDSLLELAKSQPKSNEIAAGMTPVDSVVGEIPQIIVNGRQMSDVTADAVNALCSMNFPETLFSMGGALSRIRSGVHGREIELMNSDAVRYHLAASAKWVKETSQGPEDVFVPKEIAVSVHSHPDVPLPRIRGVAPGPMFDRNGEVRGGVGYSKATNYYHEYLSKSREVNDHPDDEEVEEAKSLFFDELFVDFPFVDESSKAAALELAIRPFVRLMIDGPTPMTVVHAPTERTGKTLLVGLCAIPFTGSRIPAMTIPSEDDEIRKLLTSLLGTGRQFFCLDNLSDRRRIDSPALASLLTSEDWESRILGSTKVVMLPANAIWAATGNNPRFSPELSGRVVSCKLIANVEDPSQRSGFKHANVVRWAMDHRDDLVWAALTLVRRWISSGMPKGEITLGSYESWAEVMGGILDAVGVPGLLQNRAEFMHESNDVAQEWSLFVGEWRSRKGGIPVTVSELLEIANNTNLLLSVTGDGSPRSQATRLGVALSRMLNRVFGNSKIVEYRQSQTIARMYKLLFVGQSANGAVQHGDILEFTA